MHKPPTPSSKPCTGRGEEQCIEETEGHVAASLSPGSRVADPDEGSVGVSCSPGSYCSLHPSPDRLFIGCPIDYMLLRNIHRILHIVLIWHILHSEINIHLFQYQPRTFVDWLAEVGSVRSVTLRNPSLDSSWFLCRPGVRLNSSLIEWLFTGQCEMAALLQCGSGEGGGFSGLCVSCGLRARTHCLRLTSQPLRLSFALLCLEQRDHFLHSGQGRVVTLDTGLPLSVCLPGWHTNKCTKHRCVVVTCEC